jgi:acetylornithine/succinyldiaminopimelate/putrescine aminotransferase
VLDGLGDEALLARSRETGERLRAGLAELPGVVAVRGRGLMNAFDLQDGGAPELVRRALLEERLVLNATGPATVRALPPLVIGEAEVDEALARLLADRVVGGRRHVGGTRLRRLRRHPVCVGTAVLTLILPPFWRYERP